MAFIPVGRQERFLEIIAHPKKRKKFLGELAHFNGLDPRFIVTIPSQQRNSAGLLRLLTSKGAGRTCYLMSENGRLDGQEMDLELALREIVGYQMGTLVSCVPGKLGYFENEDVRFILERPR